MPELPEVETISRQLNQSISGKTISEILVLKQKSFLGDEKRVIGWRISKVSRKSKVIEIFFEDQREMLIIHLKMTGQLIYLNGQQRIVGGHPTSDWVDNLPSKHTRVIISFTDGTKLFFNDMRMFGWIKLVPNEKYLKEIKKQAPDVVDRDFTQEYLENIFKKSGRFVKLVLMDQEKIGGVGNIYANDALYLAGVLPTRKANSLLKSEINNIFLAVRKVINLGIKYGGASAANYVDTLGQGGKYQDHFLVYKKDGINCVKCDKKIKKMVISGRGTYYCENCQK